jgi:3-dehydroquinate dehydratase
VTGAGPPEQPGRTGERHNERRYIAAAPTVITVAPGATAHTTLAVSDVLIGNNCKHQVQVHWVQVYPPDQFKALCVR